MEQNQLAGKQDIHFIREVTALYRGPRRAKARISHPEDVAKFIASVLPDNSREHFVTIHLDQAHQIVAYSLTATGTANSCILHPREIFQSAFLVGAIALIVGHSHPSGEVEPSEEDKKITKSLTEAGELLGTKVLDHVIVGDGKYFSFTTSARGSFDPRSKLAAV